MECLLKVGFYPGNEVRLTRMYRSSPAIVVESEEFPECDSESECGSAEPALPLTVASISSPPPVLKPGYGGLPRKTAFGLYAKRRLSRAGACLDESGPVEDVVFLTGTLPGGTSRAMETIARWSAWIVHSLKKWIWKRERSSLSMYCWEYQKRGALHLHYAVRLNSDKARLFVCQNFKSFWFRSMQRVSDLSGCDVFERAGGGSWKDCPDVIQADAEPVKKSVARYLSKYLSKAVSGFESRGLACPSRWFGVSRCLSRLVAACTVEVTRIFSSRWRFERFCVPVFACFDQAEGVRWRYKDKSGMCEAHVLYPVSPVEFEILKREVIQMVDANAVPAPTALANRDLLLRYWTAMRSRFKGFEDYCRRQNNDRYLWLKSLNVCEGVTSRNFVVAARWLMSNLASYASPVSWQAIRAIDEEVSSHILLAVGMAGDPYDNWSGVDSVWRSPNQRLTPARKAVLLCQYRDRPKVAQ